MISNETKTRIRLRRSALYMPGFNTRALEKGRELPADVLIMDLEDGVAVASKEKARSQIEVKLQEGGYGRRELCVRINGEGTRWHVEDVKAISASNADAIVLPKVNSKEFVLQTAALMDEAGAHPKMKIWCMIETACGVLNANSIAGAHWRVDALTLGSADLNKNLRARHTPERLPLLASIQICVLAARANGIDVLDSPFFDLSDKEGFRHACRQGRDFGFDGKTLLHPDTLSDANEIFSPSKEELDWALRITKAYNAALDEGKGVTVVDGQLVERLHVEEAQRLIALTDEIRDRA